jgi:hypothetical protein
LNFFGKFCQLFGINKLEKKELKNPGYIEVIFCYFQGYKLQWLCTKHRKERYFYFRKKGGRNYKLKFTTNMSKNQDTFNEDERGENPQFFFWLKKN